MIQNPVDDGCLFDPIALEVVVDVKNENRKVVQVVEVQPESTIIFTFLECKSMRAQVCGERAQ